MIQTRHLMSLTLQTGAAQDIGRSAFGHRRVGLVAGGTFRGDRLQGTVLPGGADWLLLRPDDATTLDVRLVLETDGGARIGLTYRGIRHGPPEIMARLARGEAVDPASYYFRVVLQFETGSPELDWLNRIFAVGTGNRMPTGPEYEIFEIL